MAEDTGSGANGQVSVGCSWIMVLCILGSIYLTVCKVAGWINVSWWLVFLPGLIGVGLWLLLLVTVFLVVLLGTIAAQTNRNKKINRYGRY